MAEDFVLYSLDAGIALLTLNRPERNNAWTPELGEAYFDRLEAAAADPEVKAIVVTGAGRSFCPGVDMAYLRRLEGGQQAPAPSRPTTLPLSIPKLLVAAINGACAGLGLVQALYCDLRFAAAGAKLTFAFSRRGLVAEHGSSWLLPRLVGTSRALDLLLSSRVVTAEEAVALGLVNHVTPAERVVAEATEYARDVAANCSPASVAAIKAQVQRDAVSDFESACREADRLMARSLKGPDFKEGVESFLDRRSPRFAPLGKGTVFDLEPRG